MATNRRAVATGSRSETSSLFKGLVFDDAGNRMSPVHANKSGCHYRYYVSQALLQQRQEDAGSLPRLPAHDFEALISGRIVEVLGADARMKAALVKVGWNNEHDRQRLPRIIIKRIEVAKGVVRVQIDPAAALADEAEGLRPEAQTVEIACDLVRGASGVQIAIGKESGNLSRRVKRETLSLACSPSTDADRSKNTSASWQAHTRRYAPCPTIGHGAWPLMESARQSSSNRCSHAKFAE